MVALKDVSYSEAKGMVENYLEGHENAYISMPIYRNKEDAIEGGGNNLSGTEMSK